MVDKLTDNLSKNKAFNPYMVDSDKTTLPPASDQVYVTESYLSITVVVSAPV